METPETFGEYMTPAEVARLLCVTPRTVSRWADQGRISHSVTLGGHRRFLRTDIAKLLDSSRRSHGVPTR